MSEFVNGKELQSEVVAQLKRGNIVVVAPPGMGLTQLVEAMLFNLGLSGDEDPKTRMIVYSEAEPISSGGENVH